MKNINEIIPTNKFQTKITEELRDSMPKECWEDFLGYINNVPFIQNLISLKRKRACELPRDKTGRIIVNLTMPHYLENMDFFRPAALHFKEYGCYTKLKLNTSPKSEYMKWFRQELDRCWNGMVRESDGEWITGDMYFYLNYLLMKLNTTIETKTGKKVGFRKDDLPECWEGVYWRFHYIEQARENGSHGAEISSRIKSKSYSLASMLLKLFTIGIDKERSNNRVGLVTASDKVYLSGEDGILGKFEFGLDHLSKTTQFPTTCSQKSPSNMSWVCGWVDSDNNKRGPQNAINGISIADDPGKTRGRRNDLLFAEEFGKFPKFNEWFATSMPNVQEGAIVFGTAFCTGTGGTPGNSFEGALDMIYSPETKNVYGIPNVYDRGSLGAKNTVFFFPGYVNYRPFFNKDGVSDVIGALVYELKERYFIKYNSNNPMELTQRRAEIAFTLQEAIMRRDGTIYPVADLNDRVFEIDNNPDILNRMYQGNLIIRDSKVIFEPSLDVKAIQEFPLNNNKAEGAVYIKNHPENDSSGEIPWGRYIAGLDPVDIIDGPAQSMSLLSVYVLDLWTDDIVAEYTGRYTFSDDTFEIARRLLMYYNAQCCYENNKKGFYSYMQKYNSLRYLSKTLEYLKDKHAYKETLGSSSYGFTATEPVKNMYRRHIRDFLLKPVEILTSKNAEEGEAQEIQETIPNLRRIVYRALLKELAAFSNDLNTDRHDALGALMLLREERLILYGGGTGEKENRANDKNYLGNDKFFTQNYDDRFNNNMNDNTLEKLRKYDEKYKIKSYITAD